MELVPGRELVVSRCSQVAVLAGVSLAIAGMFVQTVPTGFDFLDDGALVYSHGLASITEFPQQIWRSTSEEFHNKGPFRPVAWTFWIGQQEAFGTNALAWRCFRFAWTALATATLLGFLRVLGFGLGVSILTAVVAMGNPYRAEVWMSLTHCEGIAMPFAMVGLICAYRAPRSDRAWLWDLGAMAGAVAALGCKNVFAVVIPAQMFLRMCHSELSLREGLKQFGWRSALLGSVMMLPMIHFVCYRLTMHANRYDLAWDPQQPMRLLGAFLGGMGKDFLGPALLLAVASATWAWYRGKSPEPTPGERERLRASLGAGAILFLLGWGVYSPMNGVAGRYTFPGIWGLDILCALLWARLEKVPSALQKLTYAALGCGLIVTAISLIGKQEKHHARITALWDALLAVEQHAPLGSRIGWFAVSNRLKTEELEISEGIHFQWHLQGRGRSDLYGQNYAPGADLGTPDAKLALVVTCSAAPPRDSRAAWTLVKESRHPYWFGRKEVVCCVWRRDVSDASEP